MDVHRHDSPASPHCVGVGRRHSPWTAQRQRKKNKGDEHLPVCISEDEEAQEASTMSKSCEDMIVDLQSMGFGMSQPDAGPSARPDLDATEPRRKAFLFMPCILGAPNQGGNSPAIQQPAASSKSWTSMGDVGGCLRTASANFLPCGRPAAGTSISPRRNSTSLILQRDNLGTAGNLLVSLSPVALSTDHVLYTTAAAAAVRSGHNTGSDDQDSNRRSMKRRSTDGSLARALLASGAHVAKVASQELLPPVANSPAIRLRRRASKTSTSSQSRSGDQAQQKDQLLHSESLPFALEFQFHAAAPVTYGDHVESEGFPQLSSGDEHALHPFRTAIDALEHTIVGPPSWPSFQARAPAHPFSAVTHDAAERPEEADGFRILTVLTGNDLDLAGSSDKLARRDQHLRASCARAAAAAVQLPMMQPVSVSSSPLLPASSCSVSDADCEGDCEDWDDCSSSDRAEEQAELEDEEDHQFSPMEGLAVRLIHTEQDFQTPPQSPQSDGCDYLVASFRIADGFAAHDESRRNDGSGSCSEDEVNCIPPEQILTLDEFNKHLFKAAQLGNRGRADSLWAELCCKGVRPNVQTLNSFLRCLANSFASPDEAETLAREICRAGKLSPNSVTYNLLAETRFRYEQMGLL